MNYYLNAFNEMLRKRQENQMGGQDFGQGREYASPSGPDALGLGPARSVEGQYRSDFRDTMRDMPKGLSFALGMVPGIGKAFSLAKAVDYAMGKEAEAKNALANQQMSVARQNFQATEKGGSISNTPQQSFQLSEKNYDPTTPPSNNFLASLLSGILPSSSVSLNPAPVETREATPNPYGPVGLYGDAAAGTTSSYGGGAGAPGANADGFGGGDAGFGGGSKAFNQGGMVTPERLMGQAPAPDDGYGALQGGEYVITKAAVERYGKAMMDAINNGTFR